MNLEQAMAWNPHRVPPFGELNYVHAGFQCASAQKITPETFVSGVLVL